MSNVRGAGAELAGATTPLGATPAEGQPAWTTPVQVPLHILAKTIWPSGSPADWRDPYPVGGAGQKIGAPSARGLGQPRLNQHSAERCEDSLWFGGACRGGGWQRRSRASAHRGRGAFSLLKMIIPCGLARGRWWAEAADARVRSIRTARTLCRSPGGRGSGPVHLLTAACAAPARLPKETPFVADDRVAVSPAVVRVLTARAAYRNISYSTGARCEVRLIGAGRFPPGCWRGAGSRDVELGARRGRRRSQFDAGGSVAGFVLVVGAPHDSADPAAFEWVGLPVAPAVSV